MLDSGNQKLWQSLSSLGVSVKKERQKTLKNRLLKDPHFNNLEYLLGAFMEMYEPHLYDIVLALSNRGYAIEADSGFNGKYLEYQSLKGYISVDYVTRNKLEKVGVKLRENNGFKSYLFWPENADLKNIKKKWQQIADILPDRGKLTTVSNSPESVKFRRKYIPKDSLLQKKQTFEKLKFSVNKKISADLQARLKGNPKAEKIEATLGIFLEELEPQVKNAVLELNSKGYSTDLSGFMDNPIYQMIEGDFQLDENITSQLLSNGVVVETNPSGYTRLQISAESADISKIKKQWNKIISYLPRKSKYSTASMTRKARDFRLKYC